MKKKLILFLFLVILLFLFLFIPIHEVKTEEVVWKTDGKVNLHYSQQINTSLYIKKGTKLKFLLSGDPMEDTLTISIYNNSGKSVASFAQIGNYRKANWTSSCSSNYKFVFYNPVRWHKNVSIKIVEEKTRKISTLRFLFTQVI